MVIPTCFSNTPARYEISVCVLVPFFELKLSAFLFGITEHLPTTLQDKGINIDDSFMVVKLLLQTLQRLKTDCEIGRFFKSVKANF